MPALLTLYYPTAQPGISTVGVSLDTVLSVFLLHSYVGSGSAWDLDERGGGISILPPFATSLVVCGMRKSADASVTQKYWLH